MAFVFVQICVDCAIEWTYEKDQPGGRRPKRCPDCTRTHKLELGRAAARRWTAANPAGRRAIRNRWTAEHPDEMAAIRAAWRAAHPEQVRQHRRDTKRRNPVANRAYVSARKARKRAATVIPISAESLRQRMRYFGDRCWMCGSDEGIVIDHVKPLSRGGAHMLSNLRPACHDCNTRKGARWPFPTSLSSSPGARVTRTASAPGAGTVAA